MHSGRVHEVLSHISDRLEEDTDWAVIGSCNMLLHGMEVEPNDVDIITTSDGIRVFENKFSHLVKKPLEVQDNFGEESSESLKLVLEIGGVEVEVIGEGPEGSYIERGLERRENVRMDGGEFPCIPLETDAEAYRLMGREEKAERIREFLEG